MPLKIYQESHVEAPKKNKCTLAVAAGKGGVGKSTITVNLALALNHLGFKVGIIDADVYGPSVRKMLPESRLPSQKEDIIFPAVCSNIRLISMSYFRDEKQAAAVRAPIANGIIKQFIQNVAWGDLDFLLIDFPPGTGDIQLTLAQAANITAALMVTTPQEVALLDVRKAVNLFDQLKISIAGIVENMSFYTDPKSDEKIYLFGKDGGPRLAKELNMPLLGQIPVYPEISACGDFGRSIFSGESAGEIKASDEFLSLAKSLICLPAIKKGLEGASGFSFQIPWKEM